NMWNVWLALLIVLFSISYFSGTSRNLILIEALAYIYLLLRIFPAYKKRILSITLSGLSTILMLITFMRFYETKSITEGLVNYNFVNMSSMLNAYFAGQQNVAIGVKTIQTYSTDYSIFILFKDVLANTIYFNNFVSNITGTVE